MRELSGKSLSVDLQEEGELRRRAGDKSDGKL